MADGRFAVATGTRWVAMAARYFVTFGAVQLLGAVSTFIYVRLLDKDQYALLALCLTTMAFTALATDLGLTGSINYFKRRSLQDGSDFNAFVAIIQRMRRSLFPVVIVIAIAILAVMLWRRDRLDFDGAMALAGLGAAAWVQLDLSMRQAVLRIDGHQDATYAADILAASLRAVVAAVLLIAAFAYASAVMVAIAVSSCVALWFLNRRHPVQSLAVAQPVQANRAMRRQVLRYVIPTSPAVLMFALQDMLIYATVWISAGEQLVANIFALGRLSALIAMIGGLVTVVVMPRIANMADGGVALRRGYLVTLGIAVILAGAGGFVATFPDYALLLLGSGYGDLQREFLLSYAIASIGAVAGAISQLNRAMGWVRAEPVVAALQLVSLLLLFGTQQADSTATVLWLWLISAIIYLTMLLLTTLTGLIAPRLLHNHGD